MYRRLQNFSFFWGVDRTDRTQPQDFNVTGHGAWGMGHGAWGMGHGAWGMGHGAWGMGHGAWGMGHGAYLTTLENRYMINKVLQLF